MNRRNIINKFVRRHAWHKTMETTHGEGEQLALWMFSALTGAIAFARSSSSSSIEPSTAARVRLSFLQWALRYFFVERAVALRWFGAAAISSSAVATRITTSASKYSFDASSVFLRSAFTCWISKLYIKHAQVFCSYAYTMAYHMQYMSSKNFSFKSVLTYLLTTYYDLDPSMFLS